MCVDFDSFPVPLSITKERILLYFLTLLNQSPSSCSPSRPRITLPADCSFFLLFCAHRRDIARFGYPGWRIEKYSTKLLSSRPLWAILFYVTPWLTKGCKTPVETFLSLLDISEHFLLVFSSLNNYPHFRFWWSSPMKFLLFVFNKSKLMTIDEAQTISLGSYQLCRFCPIRWRIRNTSFILSILFWLSFSHFPCFLQPGWIPWDNSCLARRRFLEPIAQCKLVSSHSSALDCTGWRG